MSPKIIHLNSNGFRKFKYVNCVSEQNTRLHLLQSPGKPGLIFTNDYTTITCQSTVVLTFRILTHVFFFSSLSFLYPLQYNPHHELQVTFDHRSSQICQYPVF